jgi:peptidyl-prolyl cis-trans isomerase D
VNLYVLKFDRDSYLGEVKVTEEDIRRYYREHSDEFTTGTRAEVRVLRFPVEKYGEKVTVSEEELKNLYESQKSLYQTEERAHARHILVHVREGSSEEEERVAKEKAEEILSRVRKGESFQELAKQFSDDPGSKALGGDLGWFKRGVMVPEFDQAVFSTRPGEVTGPVRTRFGYHIIEVLEKEEKGSQPYEKVRPLLEKDLRTKKGVEKATEIGNRIKEKLYQGVPLEKVLEGEEDVRMEEETIAEKDPRTLVKYPQEILNRIFGTPSLDPRGDLVYFGGRPFYIQVLRKLPPEVRPLSEVRDRIEGKLRKERAVALAGEKAQTALRRLKKGEKITQVATSLKVSIQETGPFTPLQKEVPLVGKDREAVLTAFSLSPKNPVPQDPLRIGDTFYVFYLKASKDPTPEEYGRTRPERWRKKYQEKYDLITREWLKRVKQEIQIKLVSPPSDLFPPQGR